MRSSAASLSCRGRNHRAVGQSEGAATRHADVVPDDRGEAGDVLVADVEAVRAQVSHGATMYLVLKRPRHCLSDHVSVGWVARCSRHGACRSDECRVGPAGAPHLPTSGRRGGRWIDHRKVINGILVWVRTGIPWGNLPERFCKRKTVYERHRHWSADGTWDRILRAGKAVTRRAVRDGITMPGNSALPARSGTRPAHDRLEADRTGRTRRGRRHRTDRASCPHGMEPLSHSLGPVPHPRRRKAHARRNSFSRGTRCTKRPGGLSPGRGRRLQGAQQV